jgi:3-dehydroquinate dehydratase type I
MNACIPLRASSLVQLKKLFKKAENKHPDLVEIWLDDLKNPDIRKIIELAPCPTIFVNRAHPTYEQFCEIMMEKSAYIDLDYQVSRDILRKIIAEKRKKKWRTQIIASYHDFKKTPPEKQLQKIITELLKTGADIIKIATYARTHEESLMLLFLLTEVRKSLPKGKKIILHAMGEYGKVGRIFTSILGSFVAYVALDQKSASAPGQWTIEEWNGIMPQLQRKS